MHFIGVALFWAAVGFLFNAIIDWGNKP